MFGFLTHCSISLTGFALAAGLGLALGCSSSSDDAPASSAGSENRAGASSGGGATSSAGSNSSAGASNEAGSTSAGSAGAGTGGSQPGAGAGGTTAAAGDNGAGGTGGSVLAADGLPKKYESYFPIGAAIGSWHLTNLGAIVDKDFNHLTAENAMKVQDIHPAENTFDWTEADAIANYARAHGMKMTGHALLWHRQAPAWMFVGVTAGNAQGLETLKARLKAHIEAMINRYGDVVDNWDVVNEAISDTDAKTYRDGGEMSKWYELFGSEEYIYWAYKYAHDALEAKAAGSAKGKLYYNEYIVTKKADKILKMFAWLETKGIHVDGVGFQSHEQLSWPTIADLQTAFDKFTAKGYKIKISELDVSVYADYPTGTFMPAPEVQYTTALATQLATRYAALFTLYRKNKANITSVTFWGISDDKTWLNSEPVAGRDDYPLLYDRTHQAKAARASIMSF